MNNIGFCKIGKSVKFRMNRYSPIGGDNEASCVLRALANNNPDKTFYIVGRSDYGTLSDSEKWGLFPYNNVIDIWEGVKPEQTDEFFNHVVNYFKASGIVLDFTVMMVGQVGTVTVPNKITQVKHLKEGITDGKPAAVIDMTKMYTSPISIWLNEEKPKYVEIVNDPRYVMNQSRDIFNLPTISIGQYDYEYASSIISSYEDQVRVEHKVKSSYAGMETAFCMDYKYGGNSDVNTSRNTNFMVVLNEGQPSRYKMLKEWVLDDISDVDIYGKWEHKDVEGDNRFKGSMHINELQNKLNDVKFTFIIPIAPGWVTSKYIEMIHAGVIPFLHPTYDEQGHTGIPEFLRPKTPAEFKERLQFLINNDVEYSRLLHSLRRLILKPDYYNGKFINNKIMTAIDENYVEPVLAEFDKVEKPTSGLEGFFE